MALDVQDIAMTGDYVPYERPPQPFTLWSAIPRGLQSFIVDGQQLDAKAINDQALLNLNVTLPPNFGYVMADANFFISQDRAGDWQDQVSINFQNFYRGPINLVIALNARYVQTFAETGLAADIKSMKIDNPLPSYPMIAPEGTSGILAVISALNEAAAASLVGTVNAFMSFWQFDLEQIRKFPVNSPIPTHAR